VTSRQQVSESAIAAKMDVVPTEILVRKRRMRHLISAAICRVLLAPKHGLSAEARFVSQSAIGQQKSVQNPRYNLVLMDMPRNHLHVPQNLGA
jgi:hypothetical protein